MFRPQKRLLDYANKAAPHIKYCCFTKGDSYVTAALSIWMSPLGVSQSRL